MDEINAWLVGGGLAVGAVFAIVVQRFRFCLVAGISSLLLIKDSRQTLAFAVAILVAITGTQLLEMMDIVAIADSAYRNNTLDWFGAAVGGLVFGIGATLAGGCAARTLVRTMEGSIHSLIVLVSFAVVAAITQFGFLESFRIDLTHATAIELTTDAGIASILSLPPWMVLAVVVAGLLLFIYKSWQRSPDKTMLAVGFIAGGLVVLSWYITGVLAQDEFEPVRPSAMTMSGPLARFGYFLISGRLAALSFAISFVIGMAVVSLLLALATRQFKMAAPAKGMVKMALLGGSLMGFGAIMAYGCNIGQGMSGLSTLSLESLIAVVGMVAGISAVTKWMEKNA
ncbi:MAG: YeeE/YedE family protein [Gammaproteobacteria bacterium]|nr:YeeE/YedE family protein [Gammaproteobacteria bacterium]MCK5091704.1 YeeE/YedE family protein [Gammaproteobacteria bacterium]